MTAPVDVLAVMAYAVKVKGHADEAARRITANPGMTANHATVRGAFERIGSGLADAAEARAAVAELVEAARKYRGSVACDCAAGGCGSADCYGQRHDRAGDVLDAALAKFGGAA